jgi:DNA-binding response OmpR family regulator
MRILIIEDHVDIADNISDFLESRGHSADLAFNGIHGLHLAVTNSYDVIILDIMLPGLDGISLCKRYTRDAPGPAPILMLTAKDTLEDKLAGFEVGADDYLIKPFALEELEARVLVLGRRNKPESAKILTCGTLSINTGTCEVTRDGESVKLNKTCYRILVELMQSFPNIVSREELEFALWQDYTPASDTLRSHMYNLRRAVDQGHDESIIETVVGMGYKLKMPS